MRESDNRDFKSALESVFVAAIVLVLMCFLGDCHINFSVNSQTQDNTVETEDSEPKKPKASDIFQVTSSN